MQLQEKDKLRLDDYVANHLPWLRQHSDKRWLKVTLRQLMSHGAGVVRDGIDSDYWQLECPFPDEYKLRQEILKAKLVVDNNTKLKYSNYGYSLLGMVVKEVSGIPYNDYVIENIVKPLDLKQTGPEYTNDIKDKLAAGYTRRDVNKSRLPIAHVDTQAMSPATGFYSTAEEMCTYFAAHAVGTDKLLDDESKKEMQRVHFRAKVSSEDDVEDYGLGLSIKYLNNRKTIGHGGGFPGHITQSLADPKNQLVVVVLTNCIDGPAQAIAEGVYSIFDYYQENTLKTKPKHDMSRLEGRYMNLWAMTDIVVTGDKIVSIRANSWQPFYCPEKLEYVDDTTLKVVDADSFSAEGELVHFNLQNGVINSINYSGSTMWKETDWLKKQSKRKRVG